MAPWPEQSSEPKAPDKEEKREVVEICPKVELEETQVNVVPLKNDQKSSEDKEVLTLDEGQLKALLDEAITYKNPKDREGKSELFKELLQEAEADESESKGLGGSLGNKLPRSYCNLPVRRRQSRHGGSGGQGRECGVGVCNTRGGSLQNLHALGMESGRRSRRRDTLVSARQREGGSLPTNVNIDNDPELERIICPNYTSRATLEVSGPSKEDTSNNEESMALFKVQGHYLPDGTDQKYNREEDSVSTSFTTTSNQTCKKSKKKKNRDRHKKNHDTPMQPPESSEFEISESSLQYLVDTGFLQDVQDLEEKTKYSEKSVEDSQQQPETHCINKLDTEPAQRQMKQFSDSLFRELKNGKKSHRRKPYQKEETPMQISSSKSESTLMEIHLNLDKEDIQLNKEDTQLNKEKKPKRYVNKKHRLTLTNSNKVENQNEDVVPLCQDDIAEIIKGIHESTMEWDEFRLRCVNLPPIPEEDLPQTSKEEEQIAHQDMGPVESGVMLYSSSPVQHVSVLSIPPSQIHAATPDSNSRVSFGPTEGKKPVDENGNALSCVRMESNCLDRKKRRVKAKNDRNTILSDDIEGFRGGADIDTLMEYIESPSVLDSNKTNKTRTNQPNGPRNTIKVRAKEEDSRIKRRKEKFQRCNSLEEISKTKLEDLMEENSSERTNGPSNQFAKKQLTLDDAELGKKSSWNEEADSNATSKKYRPTKQDRLSPDSIQDSEFHVVTKKQRKKKRRTGCGSRVTTKPDYYSARRLERDGRGVLLYQYRGDQGARQPRRKSASSVPPSDKSDSSDLDSVHSLPVSSSTIRAQVGKNSVSGGSTPQASYADIARTAASPPDGSQINIYRHEKYPITTSSIFTDINRIPNYDMLPSPLSFKRDAMTDTNCDIIPTLTNEDYPPLGVRSETAIDSCKKNPCAIKDTNSSLNKTSFKTAVTIVIPVSESGACPQPVPLNSQCPKFSQPSSQSRRPPVILLDEPIVNSKVTAEITFGFEVNQQLLQSESFQNSQLTSCVSSPISNSSLTSLTTSSGPLSQNHASFMQYINTAWEETMERLKFGKAYYYDAVKDNK